MKGQVAAKKISASLVLMIMICLSAIALKPNSTKPYDELSNFLPLFALAMPYNYSRSSSAHLVRIAGEGATHNG